MCNKLIRSTFVISVIILQVSADYYECNDPLLDKAQLSATSSLPDRGPENARLDEGKAWTASYSGFDQALIVDLGQIMKVTSIATQGRPHSSEYTMEYTISYGTNGLDYAMYKEQGGYTKTLALLTSGVGDSAWSPEENTYFQSIKADLGGRKIINWIVTKGRTFTSEWVTEFIVEYSDDGQQWKTVTDHSGNNEMFKGNVNPDDVQKNIFEVPIIAQWIKINPTRWRDRISLRLELYGCDYVAENMYFNGSSLVRLDLRNSPVSARRDSIRFRFKTSTADGVILYSKGSQGDFIALQLRHNRLLLNIDLGSHIPTSLSVGSLLDDNIWHDVVISRNRRDMLFSVDRVMIHGNIKGEFTRLNLNREIFIGGIPNSHGLLVTQNFTGCLENLYINSSNVIYDIKEAYNTEDEWLMKKYQKFNTLYSCPEPPIIPITFATSASHAKLKGYEGVNTLNVSFSFRTYEETGVLLYHRFLNGGQVTVFLEKGKIKIILETQGNPKTVLNNYDERFDDGRWHQCMLTMSENSLVLTLNGRPMKTTRLLSITTGAYYFVADGTEDLPGFVGCMRLISIDGNYKLPTDWKPEEYCCKGEIVFDSCQMTDRCNPNPCEHGGICSQSSHEFFCHCENTGYGGAVCHSPVHQVSCLALRNSGPAGEIVKEIIDIDGSGPLDPFPVTCNFRADGTTVTEVHHSNPDASVDGYQEPGSYKQDIIYDANYKQLEALTNRSSSCSQYIYYSCRQSRLFNSPSTEENFRPYAWWVSRNNQKMDYWGNSVPGSRKCHCGVVGNCIDPTKWCNCDSGLDSWLADEGEIKEKDELPVRQLRFGDTGTPLDEKEGNYRLSPLHCEGDELFDNVVTFRISDASIELPTFDMGHSGDIYFEFKTTVKNAVLLDSKGPSDFIKLAIIGGDTLQFTYQAGGSPLGVSIETSNKLADNNWHSVSIERNRKEARMFVDNSLRSEVREPPGPVRALYLTSPLVLGATVDSRDGYVGCIRGLMLNGKVVDLKSHAEKGLYGISVGCIGKCESNPCLNGGTCIEKYDGYWCDCRWTAFKGPICADEIGVNLRSNSIIKYDFMGSWRSTLNEHIRVGFTTTNPKGFLLGFFSNVSGEYLTISVSNSGHLRVVFDFGFERQELIFPNKHFGLGQYHDVRISRKNAGATLVMLVDNYEPKEFHFNVKESADAQFNNIEYMYIGRNESMSEGFIGCVSRVEFDDIYPLKLLFQEDGPPNVESLSGALTEDFCGVEPVTHPPDIIETRPPPEIDEEKLREIYRDTESAIVGGVVGVILLILLIIGLVVARYIARHKGEYLTQEDRGAELALDPDEAVIESTTGHQVQKKKEWFI